jgi:hypothetical protein
MNVKIFRAIGSEAIGKLENQINEWLTSTLTTADLEVKRTDTALCQIVLSAQAPPQAHLVVTVWWGKK